ncbi:unnamed protein product [Periconia digitata]|uniref:Small nuclear ribonucleoprotein Prp3 C-terminal domain-containing protein n=1 Tax=Periconia digitata TaxID=1303443 RepID=A0A9W4USJ3_9PLEO|nr:unnamed protein product [Periconia digitata]
MSASKTWHLLPVDLIEHQIAQIDLLMAMYPDEEITVDKDSEHFLERLKICIEDESVSTFDRQSVASVMVSLNLAITNTNRLVFDIEIPFAHKEGSSPEEGSKMKVRIRQPLWMNRAATAHINATIPEQEDLFSMIELASQSAADNIALQKTSEEEQAAILNSKVPAGPLVRAWFYFPSISTRSKRDDFIIHAPSYSLTGFLFAGKPGLLCLEGTSTEIDAYMKWIKTESWGDIPAHHKKVSERYRDEDIKERVFPDMQEITDTVGERRGTRANRGDMKAVEEWLGEKGLGDVLTKVLM